MLVSHSKKFIYLKTVKTGGTSTEVLFQPYCMQKQVSPNEIQEWQDKEIVSASGIIGARGPRAHLENTYFNHISGEKLRVHLGESIWGEYFKFANIRNPWSKTLSHFFYAGIDPSVDRENTDVSKLKEMFSTFALSYQLPKVEDFFSSSDKYLDMYVRFENLEEDIQKAKGILGIPSTSPLPQFKVGFRPSKFNSYQDLYTPAAKNHVGDIYASWITRFEYRF